MTYCEGVGRLISWGTPVGAETAGGSSDVGIDSLRLVERALHVGCSTRRDGTPPRFVAWKGGMNSGWTRNLDGTRPIYRRVHCGATFRRLPRVSMPESTAFGGRLSPRVRAAVTLRLSAQLSSLMLSAASVASLMLFLAIWYLSHSFAKACRT